MDGASIAADLESKISTSKNLIFIAEKYLKDETEIETLKQAIEGLEKANSIKEKSQANQTMDDAFFALSVQLDTVKLSDRDRDYQIALVYDYKGLNDMIDKSPYHKRVDEYLKQTAGFPASVLYKLSGVELSRFEGGSQ